MWYDNAVFYQIYPLGFSGAPKYNDGTEVSRIRKVLDWINHFKKLGVNAIYFSPLFSSSSHGYDTKDYTRLDERLGSNKDFQDVCWALKENGIRVVVDGVFNHVGREFWAFLDVINNKENSKYKDWFYLDFKRNSNYNDGFFYEGWEGHYELVKLNLQNNEVKEYLISCVKEWYYTYGIDGIRLDVAYSLDREFIKALRCATNEINGEFYLLGEVIHGDYNNYLSQSMLDSVTNYECYKGLYSSFNDKNLFEINYSLNRGQTIYGDKNLYTFVDNHDVNRLASILKDRKHLKLCYGLLFTMPGTPAIYYGSEWGVEGEKASCSDDAIRPIFEKPEWNDLTQFISALIELRKTNEILRNGSYKTIFITNTLLVFDRTLNNETLRIAINLDEHEYYAKLEERVVYNLLERREEKLATYTKFEPYSIAIYKL